MHDSTLLVRTRLMKRAARCIAGDDIDGMVKLVVDEVLYQNDETFPRLIEKVLSADKVEMAMAALGMEALVEWGNASTPFMVEHCPNVFEQWVVSSAEVANCLGFMFNDQLDSTQMFELLSGRGTTRAQRCLYELLRDNAIHWKDLTPPWIGAPGSPHRQAAINLGWQPSMLPVMVTGFSQDDRSADLHRWSEGLAYPYSLCVAVDVANRMESARRLGDARLTKALTRSSSTVCITFAENANARDTALAGMLLNVISPTYVFQDHVNARALPIDEHRYLQGLVDLHVNLDCMNVLVEALCNDTLPGITPHHAMGGSVALPSLD